MHQVAVVTFDGFNELDSFIASALINRCRKDGLEAFITTPTPVVTSMNGVEVTGQRPMEFVTEADVVLIGSGVKAHEVVADDRLISRLPLDPSRQLIGAQCSGALVLARLGLLTGMPACTDRKTRPSWRPTTSPCWTPRSTPRATSRRPAAALPPVPGHLGHHPHPRRDRRARRPRLRGSGRRERGDGRARSGRRARGEIALR